MKFFYERNTCAMGIHVLLEETGLAYEPVRIEFGAQAQYGDEYRAINPKSKVPALGLDNEGVLTEWPAIAVYLATLAKDKALLPHDPLAQARVLEIVDYVVSTIHMQGFTRIFRPANFTFGEDSHPLAQARGREIVTRGFELIAAQLKTPYAVGSYSIADAALFYVEFWAVRRADIPLPRECREHLGAMLARPAVQEMLKQEGLA